MIEKFEIFWQQFYTKGGYRTVLTGLGNTAMIAVFGLLIGIVLGALIAICVIRPAKSWVGKSLAVFCRGYVSFFRGTPIVVQLLLVYYGIFYGVAIEALPIAIMVFGLNSSAYVSEIMRAGILSIDRGQMEAGRSLGLNYAKTMLFIIIPQAIKNVIPTLCNEFIALVKDTSVAGFITVTDLTVAFQKLPGTTYEYIIPYVVLALVYLVIVLLISYLARLLERRLRRSDLR